MVYSKHNRGHQIVGHGADHKKNFTGFMAKATTKRENLYTNPVIGELPKKGLDVIINWRGKGEIKTKMVYLKGHYIGENLSYIDVDTGKAVDLKVVDVKTHKPLPKKATVSKTKKQEWTKGFVYENGKPVKVKKGEVKYIDVYTNNPETGEKIFVGRYEYFIDEKTGLPSYKLVEPVFKQTNEIKITKRNIKSMFDDNVARVLNDSAVLTPIPVEKDDYSNLYKLWKYLYDNNKVVYLDSFNIRTLPQTKYAVLVPEKQKGAFRLLLKVGSKIPKTPALKTPRGRKK